jgi:hypothetical protein
MLSNNCRMCLIYRAQGPIVNLGARTDGVFQSLVFRRVARAERGPFGPRRVLPIGSYPLVLTFSCSLLPAPCVRRLGTPSGRIVSRFGRRSGGRLAIRPAGILEMEAA